MSEHVTFEQNGHLITRRPIDDGFYEIVKRHPMDDEPTWKTWDLFRLPYDGCTFCSQRPELSYDDTTHTLRVLTPCPSPNGITSVYDLRVPSGKIVVNDSLRDVYEVPEELERDFASYNTALGQHEVVMANAELGCAYGPVGNSCPGLYRTGKNTYIIDTSGYDGTGDTSVEPEGEFLAGITTDLWAYSIADHDDYVSRDGDLGGTQVVEIPAGVYRFVHHTGERNFDRDAVDVPIVYAHIEKIA